MLPAEYSSVAKNALMLVTPFVQTILSSSEIINTLFLQQVDCAETDPFVLDADQQLGRIEVFNSLAVIAPQIELDRMRSDRRYNVTGKL